MDTASPGDAVELRVHGVSGGTAERMLDHPMVVRVAGDEHAGFYRPRPGAGAAGGATAGVAVEAYRWGALTAGAAVRTASMLLLLPFLLINLAIWLRPRPPGRFDLLAALCRVLAGTITAAFMLSTIGISLDLIGWQCVPYQWCREGRPYLSWLSALPTGPRLALLSLVPLLGLHLVWRIGARSARALEGFGHPPPPRGTAAREKLTTPGFWDDVRTPAWLRGIHVAIGVGTLDVSLLAGLSRPDGSVARLLLVPAAGLLVCCAVLLCLPVPTRGATVRRILLPLRAATAAVTLLSLGYADRAGDGSAVAGQLPGYEGSVGGLKTLQGVLLVLLAVTAVRSRVADARDRPFLGGLGTPIVAATSMTIAGAFAGALVFRVADQLDRGYLPGPVRPDPPGVAPLEPPVAYWWAALAGLATLAILAGAASITYLLTARRRRRLAERVVARDYRDAPPAAAPRLDAVRKAIARSHVAEELGPILVAFFVIAALGLIAIAFDAIGLGPAQLVTRLTARPTKSALLTTYVTDAGVWLISLLVIGFVVLAYRAYRSEQTRRTVAALFDLGDFWPRTVHPFAPPCYAARAVPELAKRVTALAATGKVIISGHSHGSVLAAATILQLPPDVLARVALLTHGSPLGRVYARLYPAYLGRRVLCETGERLHWRWRNLWRDTDPVSGPVFTPHRQSGDTCGAAEATAVDVRLRDPRGVTVDPTDTVPPPLERHWPYHTRTAYRQCVRELAERVESDRRGESDLPTGRPRTVDDRGHPHPNVPGGGKASTSRPATDDDRA
ncbi:hypothetical protein AB0H28_04690 [Micromonospora sp. NPDC050980]|uniref:hypothetical protein n=1 Tax=Micromonospora sp. NPDC050980 TaxID=3155161 RepID=UPI00340E3C58